ncbi:MAG: ATPase domain-containing protein [Candidatus Bathyarchaeia archaeon]
MVERVETGIKGLDEVIEGGFPKGSLILLAGEPGTGKTVFSTRFLAEGAELGEPGVYVSFAEAEDTLIKNLSRHLDVDLAKLEAEGKLKVLDFTTMREEAVSSILEMILREVEALKAERLVIDSFSAMAQAFKEPIDVRIVVHTVLGRIARRMGCTTVMIEEIPVGEARIGLGMEEFVADGVLRLRAGELDGRLFRDLEVLKLRGTKLGEHRLAFTLEKGFKAFPPFKPKPVERPERFQPIPDLPGKCSTGSGDFDGMLGGGSPRGGVMLLEVSENVSTVEYHLFLGPMAAQFALRGGGVIVVPSSGVDAKILMNVGKAYGATEDEFNRFIRIIEARGLMPVDELPFVVAVEGRDWREDLGKVVKIGEEFRAETGKSNLWIVGVDTLITLYGERSCEKILNLSATIARKVEAVIVAIVKAGYRDLAVRLSPIADIYLRLIREHGCLLFYGVKPRTSLYAVEMDVSKGYPLPKLTPIV